jgi:hypothetical protein
MADLALLVESSGGDLYPRLLVSKRISTPRKLIISHTIESTVED